MTRTVLAMTTLRAGGEAALQHYMEVVGPLMDKAGARLVSRHQVRETLSGADLPQFVSLIEYPDAAAVQMVFEAPDYLALKPTLAEAFSRYDLCVLDS